MNAATILSEAREAGIALTVRGDRLHVEAKPGAVCADLRARLAAAKPDLVRLLRGDLRTHLLTLAADERLPACLVHTLADADVAACAGLPDDTLRAYLRVLERGRAMDRGMVPSAWGEPVACTCEGCGPVLLWPGCPPAVKACPWCFRRKAGKAIPRPLADAPAPLPGQEIAP